MLSAPGTERAQRIEKRDSNSERLPDWSAVRNNSGDDPRTGTGKALGGGGQLKAKCGECN